MTKAINVKIDDELWQQMKRHDEINWSGVIRNSIQKKLGMLEYEASFDPLAAAQALVLAEQVRREEDKTKKRSEEIIREWRDKRR